MYIRSKEGNEVYLQWCELWSKEANTPPNLKMFFVDQFMSYWVRKTLKYFGSEEILVITVGSMCDT